MLDRRLAYFLEELRAFGTGARGRVALGHSTSLGYGTAPALREVEPTVVRREALGALLAGDHPLATGSDMVDLVALRDVPLPLHDRAANPGHDDPGYGARGWA